MTSPRTGPAVPPTREERERMLASVQRAVVKLASRLHPADREDAVQAANMLLWRLTATFDPAGPAKWVTFAYAAAAKAIAQHRRDTLKHVLPGGRPRCDGVNLELTSDDRPGVPVVDDAPPWLTADDDDGVGDLDRAVRRQLFADLLGVFEPATREIVAALVIDGLTLDQVAHQRGCHRKMVEMTLRRAVETLAAAGKVPAELGARFGIDVAAAAARVGTTRARALERRAKVAELLDRGLDKPAIVAALGIGRNTLQADLQALRRSAPDGRRGRLKNPASAHAREAARLQGKRERAVGLLAHGVPLAEVAAAVGVPAHHIARWRNAAAGQPASVPS